MLGLICKTISLAFLLFSTSHAYGQVSTRVYIEPLKANGIEYAPGDVVSAEMIFVPADMSAVEKMSALGGNHIGPFYVARVESIARSEHNKDAMRVLADLVVSETPNGSELVWEGPFGKAVVFLRSFSFSKEKAKDGQAKQIFIADQTWTATRPSWVWLLAGGLLVVLIIVAPLLGKRWNLRQQRKARLLELEKWIGTIATLNDRRSIEDFYLQRDRWNLFFESDSGSNQSYRLLTLEEVQYKKCWTEDEESAVKKELVELKQKLETKRGV